MEITAQYTPEITIKLSKYEARVLLAIANCVGGKPEGPRGVADKLIEALEGLDLNDEVPATEGSVYFR